MNDSKKSTTSASNSNSMRNEAQQKSFNPINVVPNPSRVRSKRYLYGGMLFPSRIIAAKDKQFGEQDLK